MPLSNWLLNFECCEGGKSNEYLLFRCPDELAIGSLKQDVAPFTKVELYKVQILSNTGLKTKIYKNSKRNIPYLEVNEEKMGFTLGPDRRGCWYIWWVNEEQYKERASMDKVHILLKTIKKFTYAL